MVKTPFLKPSSAFIRIPYNPCIIPFKGVLTHGSDDSCSMTLPSLMLTPHSESNAGTPECKLRPGCQQTEITRDEEPRALHPYMGKQTVESICICRGHGIMAAYFHHSPSMHL